MLATLNLQLTPTSLVGDRPATAAVSPLTADGSGLDFTAMLRIRAGSLSTNVQSSGVSLPQSGNKLPPQMPLSVPARLPTSIPVSFTPGVDDQQIEISGADDSWPAVAGPYFHTDIPVAVPLQRPVSALVASSEPHSNHGVIAVAGPERQLDGATQRSGPSLLPTALGSLESNELRQDPITRIAAETSDPLPSSPVGRDTVSRDTVTALTQLQLQQSLPRQSQPQQTQTGQPQLPSLVAAAAATSPRSAPAAPLATSPLSTPAAAPAMPSTPLAVPPTPPTPTTPPMPVPPVPSVARPLPSRSPSLAPSPSPSAPVVGIAAAAEGQDSLSLLRPLEPMVSVQTLVPVDTAQRRDLPQINTVQVGQAAPHTALAQIAPPVATDPASAALAPETSESISTPVRDPSWGERISERVLMMSGGQSKTADIRLTPAELGPVRVQVSVDDGITNVTIHAQQAVTREALEQALPRLRDMFAENNLSLGEANVGDQGVAEGNRDQNSQARSTDLSTGEHANDVIDDEAPPRQKVVASSGLVDTFA